MKIRQNQACETRCNKLTVSHFRVHNVLRKPIMKSSARDLTIEREALIARAYTRLLHVRKIKPDL